MNTPRAIVFDLDGTLIDSRGDIVAAVNHALVKSGREALPAATIARFIGDGARVLLAKSARIDASGGAAAERSLDALVADYTEYYSAHPLDFTRWIDGAFEALEAIRARGDLKTALCTNKPRAITTAVLAALDAAGSFDASYAGGDGPERKPSPEPLRRIAESLSVPTAELVMVGDGPQDILAGRAAGCRTVGLLSGFQPLSRVLEARPDITLESMSELPGIVRRWCDATARLSARRG